MSFEEDFLERQPLVYTEILSTYLWGRFKERVALHRGMIDPSDRRPPPLDLDIEIHVNQLDSPSGLNDKAEAAISKEYPPISDPGAAPIHIKPLTVVDIHNKIILWYLPNVLSQRRQAIMWEASKHLDNLLHKNYNMALQSKGWRINHMLFRIQQPAMFIPGS
ncbi:hypothetical protein JAAARDRAFT_200539 [Jaapia argillacea MUCL 33604]|uniref:Uncharacterized protein n=1 Tax=Jaapia argillacea MUCL 33604 TaxID=933084 RepID=A0A067P4T3_9AGAM|nr:hypothetical protein JAAARDRAFT_200539 [Jaapia argillacea MUCL 33604]